ncbi:MAG TPA: glycosyltransferase family A protein [Vicinamibacterales bacterium]|jgi:glycosyltransferase involved in cell wall biosynthesis
MCDFSIVIPTLNRAELLRPLLDSLLTQCAAEIDYEILVVDNGSSDGTRAVVEEYGAGDERIRYVYEPRPGVSHARNAGIERARSPIVAFIDDDVEAAPDWLTSLKRAFDEHPEADCVGGRVRPRWRAPRPSWLTSDHAGAIAVQDRPHFFTVGPHHASPCLLTANFACRRRVFDEVGLFSPLFRRGQDRELQMRMWRAGKTGVYCPSVEVIVEPPADRLVKEYHRRWHATTAMYHALMWYRDEVDGDGQLLPLPRPRRTLFGTPLFIYREWLGHAAGWLATLLFGPGDRRFYHETRLYYGASFIRTRFAQHRAGATGPDTEVDRPTASLRPAPVPPHSVATVPLSHHAAHSSAEM